MAVKRQASDVKHIVNPEGFEVKQSGRDVFIEGFSNKATVDRGDDIIATDAWELENFKKNPVILFNHGFDSLGGTPVGKAVEVKPTDEGLWIKVKMSNSKAPGIQMVRDLVEERILKAFSVGFTPKETEKVEMEGRSINRIKKAELFEVSIVAIPMNQDSLFELSEKTLKTKTLHQIKSEYLVAKGAKVQAIIESKFVEGVDREEVIEKVCSKTGLTEIQLKDMLVGDEELSEEALKSLEEELSFNAKEELQKAESNEERKATKENGAGGEDAGKEKEGESGEASKGEGGEGGEGGDEEEDLKDAFQDCVNEKVPKLIEEGMEQDQAVAAAISQCQEDMKVNLTSESKLAVYGEVFAALDGWEKGAELGAVLGSAKFEQATKQEGTEGTEPPVEPVVTQPIKTEKQPDDFGSPYLDAVKQTNVLLGAVILELQKLAAELNALKVSGTTEPAKETSTTTDESKTVDIDYAAKKLEDLNNRLTKLGC